MIAHLCRLAWNRRRTNLLLVGELFLAFLVLTPLIAGWVLFAAEELKPLGFEYENVWSAMFMDRDLFENERGLAEGEHQRNIELVWRELRAVDGVQEVALATEPPFRFSEAWNGIPSVYISDEGLEVLGLRMFSGRWFQPEDEALDWTPTVINQDLGRALFGDEDPLGKMIADSPVIDMQEGFSSPSPDRVRVVGVVEHCFYYKNHGEIRTPWPAKIPGFIFLRYSKEKLANPTGNTNYFLVKSYPRIERTFGATLSSRFQAAVPRGRSVRFEVESLAAIQDEARGHRYLKLGSIALLSGLMMLMVALGLIGMMWQNVRRRTREIGIRRATGAPGARIYGQFLGELTVLVTVAIALGCVPIVQFGLLDMVLWSRVPTYVVASSLGATAFVLYLLVLLCGLYPSWLAAKVRPVEALHHD